MTEQLPRCPVLPQDEVSPQGRADARAAASRLKGAPAPAARGISVAALQSASRRLALRPSWQVHPLAASFYIQEQFVRLHAAAQRRGCHDAEDALIEILLASISVCNQYGIQLQRAYQEQGLDPALPAVAGRAGSAPSQPTDSALQPLRAAVTMLIQNIAYYETGYREADRAALPPIRNLIPGLHREIMAVCAAWELNAGDNLTGSWAERRVPQMTECSDSPAFAASASRFKRVAAQSYCPFAPDAQIWGAPAYPSGVPVEEYVKSCVDSVARFTRVAKRERLDAYVFAFPVKDAGPSLRDAGRVLRTVLTVLSEHDPCNENNVLADVSSDGWRFRFGREDYFVPVFAPAYAHNHSRYTYDVTDLVFIVLQPDSSFHYKLSLGGGAVRDRIRQRFSDGLQPYHEGLGREADRFLPPARPGDPVLPWYDPTSSRSALESQIPESKKEQR